jgi:glycosyltransferase involved in cell wall biosynthesis
VHLQNIHPLIRRRGRAAFDLLMFLCRLIFLKTTGMKLVWTAHDLRSHSDSHAGLERVGTVLTSKLADAVITHCEKARIEVSKQPFLGGRQKVFVVPHGHYIGYYHNDISHARARTILGLPQDALVFLFFGWIEKHKGIVELIDAFQRLHSDEAHLVIAGNCPETKFADMLREKISGKPRIKLISGFVPDDKVQIYMNGCDAVVLPYRDVLTSGTVILAMSFARACVAVRRGCLSDVLNDSGAFLYEPDAPGGLLAALELAVERKNELAAMGRYNQESALQWGWDRVAQETIAVYRWVMNGACRAHGTADLNQAREAQQ